MPRLNQKGVVHLLVPIILLIGIIAGVYLIGRQTNIFPKAADFKQSVSGPIPVCQKGLNTFSLQQSCPGSDLYKQASYTCFGGKSGVVGNNTCQTPAKLRSLAVQACVGQSNCPPPTPTPTPISGTTVTLSPATGSLTPNGTATITVTITGRNRSGNYDDITGKLGGSMSGMQPNQKYDIWFISPRGLTPTGTTNIIADSSGRVSFSSILFSVREDLSQPVNIIRVAYAFDPHNPAPNGCSQYSPCLSAPFGFTSPASSPIPTPQVAKRVFVTSTTYNGNLGGLSGADTKCQVRANTTGLGGSWKAWLSDGLTRVADRLNHSIKYQLVNGQTVANGWNDLTDQSLENSIDMDENSAMQPITNPWNVWTNTWTDGGFYDTATNLTCNNWTSSSTSLTGRGGSAWTADYNWTASPISGQNCSLLKHLYCFEQ